MCAVYRQPQTRRKTENSLGRVGAPDTWFAIDDQRWPRAYLARL